MSSASYHICMSFQSKTSKTSVHWDTPVLQWNIKSKYKVNPVSEIMISTSNSILISTKNKQFQTLKSQSTIK